MSNSLDPDQARQFVGPDLGPNCLPRLSADDTLVDKELKLIKLLLYFSEADSLLVIPKSYTS